MRVTFGARLAGVAAVAVAAACGPGAATKPSPDAGAPVSPMGACFGGKPTATATPLVSGLDQPFALAVDDRYVFFSEVGGTATIKRADKADGGNVTVLASEGFDIAEELISDDTWVYYRNSALKRVAKQAPFSPQVLAAGYDNLHSNGIFAAGGVVYFAGTDKSDAQVIASVNSDGTNLTQLATAASGIHLVGLDGANIYYTLDVASGAMQMSLPRGGGMPLMIAAGDGCFDGAIDATYLYCSGVNRPFKVRLGGGSQIPLCAPNVSGSTSTLGNLAVAGNHLFLLYTPFGDGLTTAPSSGSVVSVSFFGTGAVLAGGVDDPRMMVSDGKALYWSENRQGTITKLVLP